MINNILGGLFGKLLDNTEGILDKVITTDKERLEAQKQIKQVLVNAESSAQEQVTRRWEADAKAGWLPANIRPLTLAFLTVILVVISFCDGNLGSFKMNPMYGPIYTNLMMVVYGAYFAGRSIEKIKK
jgi:hypothetical protein|tara:strand:+ start:2244 stop:2627 length:384 start_codon:yes stop_codon:yes gene_type:complete